MNWEAIGVMGSILAAFATTAAVLVALYESGAICNERISISFGLNFAIVDTFGSSTDVFEVKIKNKGNKPVYVQTFGFSFGKGVVSFMYLDLEYGDMKEPILPGKNSVYCHKKEALISEVKKIASENKGINNRKVRVSVVTELKTYTIKTGYRVKDILGSE